MYYIAASHGDYAKGTVNAYEMLTGETMPYASFLSNMSKDDLKKEYLNIINENKDEKDIAILVDIFAGTPFNVATELKYERTDLNITIVTGLSLLMLLAISDLGVCDESLNNVFEMTKIIKETNISSDMGEEEED